MYEYTQEEKKRVKKAIKESMAHWWRLVIGKRYSGEDIYCNSCALCREFRNPVSLVSLSLCEKCPIRLRTGLPSCEGSPWIDAYERRNKRGEMYNFALDTKSFKQSARKMHQYLKELIPYFNL